MKFSELNFETCIGGFRASRKFSNGYTISVGAGDFYYSEPRQNLKTPDKYLAFEVAVFAPNGDWATREFFPDLNDDVSGWQDRDEIESLMYSIENKK